MVSVAPSELLIADYELIRAVGQGGMAQVWLARKALVAGATKACALKVPLRHLARDPRFRRMFLAEARLAMGLTHSNIVGTFDAGADGDLLYMAMDWVDGVDLSKLQQTMRDASVQWSPSVAAHIVGEVLHALSYAHGFSIGATPRGIVHRDVSPHNVLVSASGEVKLTDFGIARIANEDTSHEHAKGKLRYMAAEQLRGGATQRSDLFAVGAILHELLDGKKFRDGLAGDAFFGAILAGEVPSLVRSDVPQVLEKLRRGLLEPDQAHRIGSADEALALLAQWSGYRSQRVALRKLYQRRFGTERRSSGLTGCIPWTPEMADTLARLGQREPATRSRPSRADTAPHRAVGLVAVSPNPLPQAAADGGELPLSSSGDTTPATAIVAPHFGVAATEAFDAPQGARAVGAVPVAALHDAPAWDEAEPVSGEEPRVVPPVVTESGRARRTTARQRWWLSASLVMGIVLGGGGAASVWWAMDRRAAAGDEAEAGVAASSLAPREPDASAAPLGLARSDVAGSGSDEPRKLAAHERRGLAATTAAAAAADAGGAEPSSLPSPAPPSVPHSGDAAPGMAKPSTAQPSTAQPSTAQPSAAKPSTAQPSTAQPSTAQPSTAQPSTAKPSTAKPEVPRPKARKSSPGPRPTPAPPRVTVDIVLDFVDEAEVMVGRTRRVVRGPIRLRIGAGRYRVAWRKPGTKAWVGRTTLALDAEHDHLVRIRPSGVRHQSLSPR